MSSSPKTVRPSAAPVSSLNMWWAWSSAFWQNSVFLNNLALIVNKTEELTVGFRVNREEHARFYINWAPVEQVSEFKSPSFLRSLHSSSIQSILLYHQVWKLHCRGMQRSSESLLIYLFALLPDVQFYFRVLHISKIWYLILWRSVTKVFSDTFYFLKSVMLQ